MCYKLGAWCWKKLGDYEAGNFMMQGPFTLKKYVLMAVQSDNSQLKCSLRQYNIVTVWHLGSDLFTSRRYIYIAILGSDEQTT